VLRFTNYCCTVALLHCCSYDGNYKQDNDIKHGNGKFSFANGNVYDGNWKDDMMHGNNGKLSYANGDVYDGNFKASMKHNGKGKYTNYYTSGDVAEIEYSNGEEE